MGNPSIAPLTCHDIHSGGCQSVIEPSYAFCPGCGRATVSLRPSSSSTLTFPREGRTANLPLRVRGQRPLVVSARIEEGEPLRLKRRDEVLTTLSARLPQPASLQPTTISLPLYWNGSTPPPVDGPLQIPVFLISQDREPINGFDIEEANRARVWEPLYLLVSAPRPAQLEIETVMLILGGRSRQRILTLHNAGETPLLLRPPVWPAGLEAEPLQSGPGEWTIGPQSRKSWRLRARPGARPGARAGEMKIPLHNAAGQSVGEICVLIPAQGGLITRTRYVLGVDFGTTGTSIWKRDGRDDRLEAQPLLDSNAVAGHDDPHRFPSVLYVSFRGGHESGFYIGYEAVRQQKEDASKGLWVRELKSLLRADDEPFVAQFGPNYRVDLLLRRYLEKLKTQIINPQLEGGEMASVAWNFSLPVLDSHRGGSRALFARQKGRLERAIRDAGYVRTGDALEFFTEPYCAAIYLLLEHGHYRYPRYAPPQDGDWACIFDSGGGTTDVVLGQVHLEEGQMRFEEVATLGGYLAAHSPGGEPAVSTFGGEALTRTTAIYLSVWENANRQTYDFLRPAMEKLRLRGPNRERIYNGLREVALLAAKNEEVWRQSEVALVGEPPIENGWVRFPDLWEIVESYKRQIASLGAPGARVELDFGPLALGEAPQKASILRSEFDRVVVNRRLDAIGTEMQTRIFPPQSDGPSPIEVKWVFGVGGNCRVRRIQDWLNEFFPGGVQELTVAQGDALDESDRMLAVAGGAVWAGLAARDNTLPYALRIEDERGQTIFQAAAQTPLGAVRPATQIYDLRFEQSVALRLFIDGKVPGETGSVPFSGVAGCFSICNLEADANNLRDEVPRRAITLQMALDGRHLSVRSDESGAMQEVFSYPF